MRIISWNVNGIRAIVNKGFIESLKKMNADILCLQETRASDKEVENALFPLVDYTIYSNAAEKKGYSGTALLCKNKPISFTNSINIIDGDTEGRLICTEYSNFYLVNVYAPNAGQLLERLEHKKNWNSHFLEYLKRLDKLKPVIAIGRAHV